MIITFLLKILIDSINALLSFFPTVTVLPTIFGINVDTQLSTYWAMLNSVRANIWVIDLVIQYFTYFLLWKITLMGFKFVFGHRAPQSKQALH